MTLNCLKRLLRPWSALVSRTTPAPPEPASSGFWMCRGRRGAGNAFPKPGHRWTTCAHGLILLSAAEMICYTSAWWETSARPLRRRGSTRRLLRVAPRVPCRPRRSPTEPAASYLPTSPASPKGASYAVAGSVMLIKALGFFLRFTVYRGWGLPQGRQTLRATQWVAARRPCQSLHASFIG